MQQTTLVGEGGAQRDSTRLVVDGSADGADGALLVVVLAVVQAQTDGWRLADELLDRAILCDEVEGLILADAEIDVHL